MKFPLEAAFQHHRTVTVQAGGGRRCGIGDDLGAAVRTDIEGDLLVLPRFAGARNAARRRRSLLASLRLNGQQLLLGKGCPAVSAFKFL